MTTTLPAWDLSDLYAAPTDPQIQKDLTAFREQALDFEKKYKGQVARLAPSDFAGALQELEAMEKYGTLIGYASLYMATQMNNPQATAFYQDMGEAMSDIGKHLVFFTLEINDLNDTDFQALLADKQVQTFAPFLKRVRLFRAYQLTEKEEQLLVEKAMTSTNAWVRLYEESCSKMQFTLDGKTYNEASIIHKALQSAEPQERTKAAEEMDRVYRQNSDLFTFVYNMILKDKAIEDDRRGYAHAYSERNLAEDVPDEMVDALVESVKKHYSRISHRYYRLKARWLGVEKINYWDRSAPLPFDTPQTYTWDEAVKTVLEAYGDFSPRLKTIAQDFFTHQWIDVPPRPGKRSGAFCSSVCADKHPYLLLNFMGKTTDVLTLAHELGHGCHHQTRLHNGSLNEHSRMTSEEVASVFGEMLTFQRLLRQTTDDKERLSLIAAKVGDMIATAFRQIAFYLFERRAHAERKKGELSAQTLQQIWLEELGAYLGPAVLLDSRSAPLWPVGHFFFLPFYVYAYSFADCLVNSLYQTYASGAVDDFANKYLHLLSQTAIGDYDKILAPFGLDPHTPDFWDKGLQLIEQYIDELEELDKKVFHR